ncbi:MAG TPA: transporter substrate-binding domain-containing protein [Myxococcales bacterium]|nr:transporter substrate-binding domain-containing protein [Myxococcales bacterium]
MRLEEVPTAVNRPLLDLMSPPRTKSGQTPISNPTSITPREDEPTRNWGKTSMSARAVGIVLSITIGWTTLATSPAVPAPQAKAQTQNEAQAVLRVGTSGDYAPFSITASGDVGGDVSTETNAETDGNAQARYQGLGPDLARAYAKERNLRVHFVRFRWPDLVVDLEAGRFDVAMSGITVRPERSLAGRFTLPIALSGALALVPTQAPVHEASDLNRPGLRIAVNAGGHLERTARRLFARATVVPIANNAGVMDALAAGLADAVITDTREAPYWLEASPGLRAIGPFTRDRKALLVAAEKPELARDLDDWLLAQESNGQMAARRTRYLNAAATSGPGRPVLSALLAGIAERLALMPLVAEAKRASQTDVEAPAREAQVIEAALARVRQTESTAGIPPNQQVGAAAVTELFVAQMAAAKSIQRSVLAQPPPLASGPPPALDSALRPALLRIGDRIARLIVLLPRDIPAREIEERSQLELGDLGLPEARVAAIAHGLMAVSSAP